MKRSLIVLLVTFVFSAAFFIGCQKSADVTGPNDTISINKSVVTFEGNPRPKDYCATGIATGNINLNKVDGEWVWSGNFPDGIEIFLSEDGKYIDWESDGSICISAIVVKGGPNANIYYYTGENYDDSLHSPDNNGGNVPTISHLAICYTICGGGDCSNETAFGGNTEGAGSAWWYYFDASVTPQDIYAGQNPVVGASVAYTGTHIIITLPSNVTLQSGTETVKIQGYVTPPAKRPSAGQFQYKGNSLSVAVDQFPYYVIHLDVVVCEEE